MALTLSGAIGKAGTMKILCENDRGYLIRCGCGQHFISRGNTQTIACGTCGKHADIDDLVHGWWANAGWTVSGGLSFGAAPAALPLMPMR